MKSFSSNAPGRRQRIHSRLIAGWLGLLLLPLSGLATPPTPTLQYTFDNDSGNTYAADTGVAPQTNGYYYANQNGATSASTISLTTNTPGGHGYALNLVGADNGTNNFLQCGNPDKLNNITNLTLTCWLNLQGAPLQNDRLWDKTVSGGSSGWYFVFDDTNATNISFRFFANSTTALFTSTGINATNQWVFLAVTFNGNAAANNTVLYAGGPTNAVSGVKTNTVAQTWLTNVSNVFRVGSTAASGSDRTPPAWLDDVRVYNNVALSAADVELVREQNATPGVTVSVSPSQAQILAGTDVMLTANAIGFGAQTPTYQWLFKSNAIAGANSSVLTLTNIQITNSGTYGVVVSNNIACLTNNGTLLTVVSSIYNPAALTNLWTLLPPQTNGATVWLTTGNTLERSMAYNPATAHLLVVHRTGVPYTIPDVNVMDALTGANVSSLDETALDYDDVNFGYSDIFPIDQVVVANDGTIYAGNLTLNATSDSSSAFALYSWANEAAVQAVAFAGDPGAPSYPGLRWGDAMAIQGTGTNTQILLASASTTNIFALLTTADGVTFSNSAFAVTNLPAGSATVGLAWAAATNTFYCKANTAATNRLYLVQLAPGSGFGSVQSAYTTNGVPGRVGPIGVNLSSNLLAGLQITANGYDLVNLYGIANTANNPVLLGQQSLDFNTTNTVFSGIGSVDFANISGTNYLFVLDTGNGIFAYQLTGISVIAPDTNAYLSSLTLTGAGVVNVSAFSSNVISYAVSEPYGSTPVLTVTNADLTATNVLIYNGVSQGLLASGTPSGSLALTLGLTNVAKVLVTAQDGVTTNLYTVNITEQPSLTRPKLTNTVNGGTLRLSWPGDHLGYRLLVQTNNLNKGISANTNDWMTVPGSAAVTSTNLPVSVTNSDEFYRLVYP